MPAGRSIQAALAAAALLGVAGCQPSVERAVRDAAQPAAIAVAMCAQYRPKDPSSCDKLQLPDPAPEIAYAGCLGYNRKDPKPCGALRIAYESKLHAYLDTTRPQAPTGGPVGAPPPSSDNRTRVLYRTAVELFKASNSDAETFQAALLIPQIRHKIELVLGQRLSDVALQALIKKTRAEAVYWYQYMQVLESRE